MTGTQKNKKKKRVRYMILKNTIQMTDESSPALQNVKDNVESLIKMFSELAKNSDSVTDSIESQGTHIEELVNKFDKLESKSLDVAESIELQGTYLGNVTEKFIELERQATEFQESMDLTGLAFETAHEMAEEFKQTVYESVPALIEVQEQAVIVEEKIENITAASSKATKGIQGMTSATGSLLGSFGLLPPALRTTLTSVNSLTNGLARAVPVAAKLSALIAPLTLAAMGIMAIVETVKFFSKTAVEELSDVENEFNRITKSADELNQEAARYQDLLYENIILMERMIYLGASDPLIEHLQAGNKLLEERIETFRTLGLLAEQHAAREIAEKVEQIFDDTMRRGKQIWGNFYEILTESVEMQEFNQLISSMEQGNKLTGFQQKLLESAITSFTNMSDVLRNDVNPEHHKLADLLDEQIGRFNIAAGNIIETNIVLGEHAAEIARLEREYARLNAIAEVQERTQNHLRRSYRDVYDAAERMRIVHTALSDAIYAVNTGQNISLDVFHELMGLSPHYLTALFDEQGALLAVEDAVLAVTQAKIDQMSFDYAMTIINDAKAYVAANNSLQGYTATIRTATDGLWGMVEAELALLAVQEQIIGKMGNVYYTEDFNMLASQIELVGSLAESARRTAREQGVYRTVSTSAGNALLVYDPANREIKGEITRMMEDVARHRYVESEYQIAPPRYYTSNIYETSPKTETNINMGGTTVQVYASPGMDEERLAQRAGEYASARVANEIRECCRSNLVTRNAFAGG